MTRLQRGAAAGFTLIELLVVIAILGVLAAALLPNVLGVQKEGEIAETEARMQFLVQAIARYERKLGHYPPDQFTGLDTKVKADAVNQGIEALVIALCEHRLGRDSLASHEDWLANVDGDKAGVSLPQLDRQDKVEVVDAWGMPFAYFCSQTGGYERQQKVQGPDGAPRTVQAMRNPRNGNFLASREFQILSAGPDGEFNTADDVTHPPMVEKD